MFWNVNPPSLLSKLRMKMEMEGNTRKRKAKRKNGARPAQVHEN